MAYIIAEKLTNLNRRIVATLMLTPSSQSLAL